MITTASLKFLYSINSQHPFYLDSLRFDTPEQLVQQAQADASLWNKIAEATANGQIQVWLARHWQGGLGECV